MQRCFVFSFLYWLTRWAVPFSHMEMQFTRTMVSLGQGFDSCVALQSSFFASFMCFEVLPLNPPSAGGDDDDKDDDDISVMEMDGTDIKSCETNYISSLDSCDLIVKILWKRTRDCSIERNFVLEFQCSESSEWFCIESCKWGAFLTLLGPCLYFPVVCYYVFFLLIAAWSFSVIEKITRLLEACVWE